MSGSARLSVLALAPYPESAPSTRFRVAQLRSALAEHGVDVTLHPFLTTEEYGLVRRRAGLLAQGGAVLHGLQKIRSAIDESPRFHVVMIQRGIGLVGDGMLLRRLQRRSVPIVYDFDDAVFLSQEGGRGWLDRIRDPEGSTAALCRAARVVLAGNEYLAEWARGIPAGDGQSAERVRVLPSVVDTDRYRPPGSREPSPVPTIGWVGSDSTVPYLETLAPALRELAERVPHRLVVVAGERRPHLPGVAFDYQSWSPAREVAVFQGLDVGLYPLDDTPWSQGKCGFKALQYMACGVPCVASPVGVLRQIVTPEETGLHATSDQEWIDACARLLGDVETRHRMGGAGRERVEADYSVRTAAPLLAEALREAGSS